MKKENPICAKCNHKTIKHGVRNGKQRYRCKNCNITFYAPNQNEIKYQRNSKRIMSLLFNILENDFFNVDDLEEALNTTQKYYKYARKVQFNTKYKKEYKNQKDIEIGCYKAKLLICQDDKNITFFQIPSYKHPKGNEVQRTITIRDNPSAGYSYSNTKYNIPLIKENINKK